MTVRDFKPLSTVRNKTVVKVVCRNDRWKDEDGNPFNDLSITMECFPPEQTETVCFPNFLILVACEDAL